MNNDELYTALTTPATPRKIRVALESVEAGVEEMTVEDLEDFLDETSAERHLYLWAEYVDDDSPYTTWEDIRRHGRTCRAYALTRRR